MAEIEETTDNDIAEVAQSKSKFGAVEEVTDPVGAFFSLLTAEKLMGVFERAPKKAPLAAEKMTGKSAAQVKHWRSETEAFEWASAFQLALDRAFGDPLAIAIAIAIAIAGGEAKIAPPDHRLDSTGVFVADMPDRCLPAG